MFLFRLVTSTKYQYEKENMDQHISQRDCKSSSTVFDPKPARAVRNRCGDCWNSHPKVYIERSIADQHEKYEGHVKPARNQYEKGSQRSEICSLMGDGLLHHERPPLDRLKQLLVHVFL